MDKFLSAGNQMAGTDTLAIIHMLPPVAILLCIEGHVSHQRPHRHYSYTNIDGAIEDWTIVIWHFFTTEFDSEIQNIQIEKLLKQAWHWYMAYMEWEDNYIEDDV